MSGSAAVHSVSPRLRLATLNVWGVFGDWPRRRAALVEGFDKLRPDLVTLQECVRTADYDQARDILGPDYRLTHQTAREDDGRGVTTASRLPVGEVTEIDLNVTERTAGFACTSLATEILAPEPYGRVLLVNNLPNWQLDMEYERVLQAERTARAVERMRASRPAHVVVAGDFDADPQSDSIRFWSGRHVVDGLSVCYRDAWDSAHPDEPGHTYGPDSPLCTDLDWPFERIDYIFVRCGEHGGSTLPVLDCDRIFHEPVGGAWASDHFGVLADLGPPVTARL